MLPEVLQFGFMQRALIAGAIIGVIAPLMGTFLVVRRYSLLADTLAHVSLLGVAIGLSLRINPMLSAIVVAVLAGVSVERLRTGSKLYAESLLLLFMTGSLAIAVVIIGLSRGYSTNLFSYLFGSISTVSPQDIFTISILGILVCLGAIMAYKELFFLSYDEELAEASGIPSKMLNVALIELAALTIGLSMTIVGILLVEALMVIPVITAMLFRRGFKSTMLIAIAFSEIAVLTGLSLSYYTDVGSGGMIVVVAVVLFALSLLFRRT